MWLKTFTNQLKLSKECEEITVFDNILSIYSAAELSTGVSMVTTEGRLWFWSKMSALHQHQHSPGVLSSQSRPADAWLIVLTS